MLQRISLAQICPRREYLWILLQVSQDAQLPLPLFAGPIPMPRAVPRGPVRRDGGAENGFEILARGTPVIWWVKHENRLGRWRGYRPRCPQLWLHF